MLWRDAGITMESLGREVNTKGKNVSKAIIKSTNTATGKETSKDKSFTEPNWGKATRGYLTSVKNLRGSAFNNIVAMAKGYAKINSKCSWESDEDERAILVDHSDEGEWFPFLLLLIVTQVILSRLAYFAACILSPVLRHSLAPRHGFISMLDHLSACLLVLSPPLSFRRPMPPSINIVIRLYLWPFTVCTGVM
jgi:hypothetical protein